MLFTEFNIDIAKEVWQEEARMDALAEGRAEGRTEGRAEGENKRAVEIARKMIRHDRPLAEVAEITGLTLEEVEPLRECD